MAHLENSGRVMLGTELAARPQESHSVLLLEPKQGGEPGVRSEVGGYTRTAPQAVLSGARVEIRPTTA